MWPYTVEELEFINGEQEDKKGRLLQESESSLYEKWWDMAFGLWQWSPCQMQTSWCIQLG